MVETRREGFRRCWCGGRLCGSRARWACWTSASAPITPEGCRSLRPRPAGLTPHSKPINNRLRESLGRRTLAEVFNNLFATINAVRCDDRKKSRAENGPLFNDRCHSHGERSLPEDQIKLDRPAGVRSIHLGTVTGALHSRRNNARNRLSVHGH